MVLRMTQPALLLGALFALTIVAPRAERPRWAGGPALVSPHRHAPIIIRERHGRNITSDNWSGYAVTGARGSVTDVKASWTVPAIQGSCPSTNQYSSFWVGIDGYSSSTVEQIGTDSDCMNGKPVYYAWFEFYPHPSFTVNNLTIAPGDVISAEVSAGAKGEFTVTLTDTTTGGTFSTSTKIPSASQSSAEWIAEAPWSGGVLPLADFGVVSYGQNNDAKVGSATGPIGSFTSDFEITMVDSNGATKAQPSALASNNSSFSITWYNPGP